MKELEVRVLLVIDGDIAQLLATNNMLGVSVFSTDPSDPYYGAPNSNPTEWFNRYMPDNFINNVNAPQNWDLSVQPGETRITSSTSPFPLITRDFGLTTCLLGGGFGVPHTQVVPYYNWRTQGTTFGTYNNDYDYNSADASVTVVGYQQGLYYEVPLNQNPDTWISPYFYDGGNPPPPLVYFTNAVTGQTGGIDIGSEYRLGTGLFFYFGLRPGGSAYEKFINEYLPPRDDE